MLLTGKLMRRFVEVPQHLAAFPELVQFKAALTATAQRGCSTCTVTDAVRHQMYQALQANVALRDAMKKYYGTQRLELYFAIDKRKELYFL